MSKRTFNVDTTSLSTAKPLLDNGFYAGTIVGASIEGKEGKQFFTIREERKWDKDAKEMVLTGDYELNGMLMYSVSLTSKKAIKTLQQDEPRIFGGMIFFRFDKETYCLEDNVQLGQLLSALDLKDTNFDEMVDFDFDDDIEVPEELARVPDIVTKLNALEYAKGLMTVICQTINNMPVKAKVIKQANRDNSEVQENVLDMGSRNAPFCGVLPYEEGSEDDLDEE